ncbi:transcriptional regulator, TetR family [Paenibacillus curdlanolyticus YK9]|uniref:Transcriptional regulator, TetR family n=1 Tax=Paenibacillus curdlanolyticus YK9 TaxID=717606 RepID=E0I4G8_9BACL|nr:TetR/AcrR family transcriptional regulator [Paenibacillus curdlanolyticus]EFM12499.1 transcriptional regulator, TetR family [Paenibacillus curdlanolyticus YK9]
MVRPREFDEQQALSAAMQVFWEKGYEATSISDLTTRMGIQRPSLYAAFGGKKELFETVLHKYTQISLTYIENLLSRAPSAREAVRIYLQGIIEGGGGRQTNLGCLCINTMVELAPHDQSFAHLTKDYQLRITELLRQTIEDGIRKGELASGLNAVAIARALTVSAVGLAVTMKSAPEHAYVENAVTELLTLLV